MNGAFSNIYATWTSSVSSCCFYLTSCYSDRSQRRADTPAFAVVEEQPIRARAPRPDGLDDPFNPFGKETLAPSSNEKPAGRKSFASSLRGFSTRNIPFLPQKPPRSHRLRISSPTNFRHVYSHSYQYSDPFTSTRELPNFGIPRQEDDYLRQQSFQPLQLGANTTRLSPILPYFEPNDGVVTPPPAARLRDEREDEIDGFNLKRSRSSLSFHVPRRRAMGGSQSSTPLQASPQIVERQRSASSPPPPEVPPKSRARAYTAPEAEKVDTLKERIAEAMMERDRLQELIDDVVERQSIYLGSRPSTAHSMRTQILANAESVPAIPALPPMAPSFAERLNPDFNFHRAETRTPGAQTQAFAPTPTRATALDAAAAFQFSELAPAPLHIVPFQAPPTPPRSRASDRPIQPPLPLVLRPPLRKKKSFSRVSTWLFPNAAGNENHQRGLSVDSITNVPRPVRDTDGFYQCVSPPGTSGSRRLSTDTVSTVATWASDEEETVPTTLSPCQSPGMMLAGASLDGSSGLLAVPRGQEQQQQRLDRMGTFGRNGRSEASSGSGISGASTVTVVGVAF